MHRLLNIPYIGGEYFNIAMITNAGGFTIGDANEILSFVLKLTSLISFGVFVLLNWPRVKVRLAQIRKKKKRKSKK